MPRARLWRSVPRLIGFALLNLICVPLYVPLRLLPLRRWRRAVEIAYCAAALWLVGLTPRVTGRPAPGRGVLYVSNHVSYLDILVLNRLIDGSFVAKAEVATWPLIGLIGRLTRTVFIKRQTTEARKQSQEIVARLATGDNLILFPEGTTTGGQSVAPFKSSLLAIAEMPDVTDMVTIQPVSIAYTRYADGTPLTGERHRLYTWYGNVELMPHVMQVMGLIGADVEVVFHPPIARGMWTNRKDLTRRLQGEVARGVAETWRRLPSAPTSTAESGNGPRLTSAG